MELYGDDMIMLVIGAGGDDDDDGDGDDARGSIGWKGSISGVLWILDPPYSLKIVVVPSQVPQLKGRGTLLGGSLLKAERNFWCFSFSF